MASRAPTRVVGYVRVSTEQQAGEGVSLEAQRARLEAFALATELQLVELIEDAGLSAKSLVRPGLQRALAALEAGAADGLLVVKLDRLTRSVRDLGDLVERYFATRFSLLSVGDAIDTRSASGRLVLNVLCSVAQWEREATGERTREALAHLKRQGVRLGAPALGGRQGGREADADEGVTVARIGALHAGGQTLRAIASALTAEGHRTKRGGTWGAETVRKVLARRGAAEGAVAPPTVLRAPPTSAPAPHVEHPETPPDPLPPVCTRSAAQLARLVAAVEGALACLADVDPLVRVPALVRRLAPLGLNRRDVVDALAELRQAGAVELRPEASPRLYPPDEQRLALPLPPPAGLRDRGHVCLLIHIVGKLALPAPDAPGAPLAPAPPAEGRATSSKASAPPAKASRSAGAPAAKASRKAGKAPATPAMRGTR